MSENYTPEVGDGAAHQQSLDSRTSSASSQAQAVAPATGSPAPAADAELPAGPSPAAENSLSAAESLAAAENRSAAEKLSAAETDSPSEAATSSEAETRVEAESEPTAAETPAPSGFAALPLSAEVLQAVQNSGYDEPTDIQAEITPHMIAGRDVLAQSQTGTGKTAAFALPILTRLQLNRRDPQVLVLAPTRELAIQVAKSFSTYGSCLPDFRVAAIYGGQDYEPQLKQLRRGAHVVVGTPGRVIDHIKRGTLNLSQIECLVLDEADEMLNMGFLEDVQFVLEQAPPQRQIALFSATLPPEIQEIAKRYLNDPAKITIKRKTATADSIRQRVLFVAPRDKVDALTRFLEAEPTAGVIVFTKTKDATVSVADQLSREGFSAVALNGDMPQKVRERTIDQLKSGRLDILVATDVAARGLDVTRISHVFNYDLPHDSESYIHRVGRTGRAGRKGEAIIFLTNAQRGKLRLIERATKQPIEVVQPPSVDDINAVRIQRFKQRLDEVTAEQDLTMFKDLISDYAAQSGKPMEMIAAALAQIGQQGRPFLMKERPKKPKQNDFREADDRGAQRGGKKQERRGGSPRLGMNRYRIEVGWRDGVKPGNIVGAVANEAGLDGSMIGSIDIHNSYSTIDLPEGMPRDIYQTLQRTRVGGKQLRLSEVGDTRATPARGGKSFNGKGPRGKNFSGGPKAAHAKAPQGKPLHGGKKKKKRKVKA